MNKPDLIEKIAEDTQIPKKDVNKVVVSFCNAVKDTLKKRENVRLVGFGTFTLIERKERMGINPHTKEDIKIPARHYPKFRPGKEFKEYLN